MHVISSSPRALGALVLAGALLACSGGDPTPGEDLTASPTASASPTTTATAAPTDDPAARADMLVATDGSFRAAVPPGFVDLRVLLDDDEREQAVGDLGLDLSRREITELLEGVSIDANPWIAIDLQHATRRFAPRVLVSPIPLGGRAPMAELLDEFNAQNGTFGETPSGDRTIQDVAGREAIVYEYTQPVSGLAADARGTQVAVYAGELLHLVTYVAPRRAWDDDVVPTIVASLESLG